VPFQNINDHLCGGYHWSHWLSSNNNNNAVFPGKRSLRTLQAAASLRECMHTPNCRKDETFRIMIRHLATKRANLGQVADVFACIA
jgi:hypothetical protein